MSDEDLWRPKEPQSEAVNDQTQPITGSDPAPAAPSPSSEPPSGPGAVPPPQNPYGQPSPYGAPPSPNPFGVPQGQPYAPPPNPYQGPNEYSAPQSPYGAPYQPAYAGGALPDHPSATTAMVLGIIGLASIVVCAGVLLVLSPFAWAIGAKAVREIDAQPGRYGGRDRAQGGKIMGIIGTVLLVLGVLAIIAFIALVATVGTSGPQPVFPNPSFQNG